MILPNITTLKSRLILLGILPTMAMSIMFASLFLTQQMKMKQSIKDLTGQKISLILAYNLSEFTQNWKNNALLQTSIKRADVAQIDVFSTQGKLLLHLTNPSNRQETASYKTDIASNHIKHSSEPSYVVVYLSKDAIDILPLSTLAKILVPFIAFIFALILFSYLSRKILKPIKQLSTAVEEMKRGNFSARMIGHAEDELQKLNEGFNSIAMALDDVQDKMQSQVEQATHDLTETLEELEIKHVELDLARKRAQTASRVKTEFLANMSHEIRTPIHGIMGFTKLLSESKLTNKQSNLVHTISKSSTQLLNIINNILNYSTLEYGSVEPSNQTFNLNQCFEESIDLLSALAHDKGLELVLLIYNDVPKQVIGDDNRIQQIIINLLSNAIKFTDTGDIIIRVMLEERTTQQCIIAFSITDTGIGIDQYTQKHLFRSFNQVDLSTSRQYGGTGLGLSICQKLLQSINGSIRLESQLDQGSEFHVQFPLDIHGNHKTPVDLAPFQHKTVLLIEDHLVSKAALHKHLVNLGFTVSQIEHHQIPQPINIEQDLVIISFQYQQLLKPKLEQILHPLIHNCRQPIIFLHSSSDRFIIDQLEERTQSPWLAKPVHHDDLHYYIEQVFSQTPHHSSFTGSPQKADFLAGQHLLVVDDNSINLDLISQLLRDKGAKITRAKDGEEALQKVKERLFTTILMDIHMPGMSGIETSQLIREFEGNRHRTPIIALTADIMPDTRIKALNVGIDEILIKPIQPKELWKAITPFSQPHHAPIPSIPHNNSPDISIDITSLSTRDTATALHVTGGNEELAEAMYERFLTELPQDINDIQYAINAWNWDTLFQTNHRLLGSTSVCGIQKLGHALRRLEAAIHKQHKPIIMAIMQDVNREVHVLLEKIAQKHD